MGGLRLTNKLHHQPSFVAGAAATKQCTVMVMNLHRDGDEQGRKAMKNLHRDGDVHIKGEKEIHGASCTACDMLMKA